jgi:single-strand DNA-binding protein
MFSNTGINKIILLGQISKEPQYETMANKQRFLLFTLVTNEAIKKGNDNVEHNEYHNIKVPEKLITQEGLELELGLTIYVEGKIHTESFFDERRVKRYNLEIIASKVEILNLVPATV